MEEPQDPKLQKAIETLKAVYIKHNRQDESIGWEELETMVSDTLADILGEENYIKFIQKH